MKQIILILILALILTSCAPFQALVDSRCPHWGVAFLEDEVVILCRDTPVDRGEVTGIYRLDDPASE